MTRTPFSLLLSAALALAVLTGCGDRDDMPPITGERATDAGTANPGNQVREETLDDDGSAGMDASPYDQTGAGSQGTSR